MLNFRMPAARKPEAEVWMRIHRAFSEPATTGDIAADYVLTHLFASLFKNEGYDGIAYKSAFGKKDYNIVLFDPPDAF